MFISYKKAAAFFSKSLLKNRRLNTYLFFFVISFSFWFLTMLSKTHETTLQIPLSYVNYPADLTEIVSPADFILVRVKASGISISLFYLFSGNFFYIL